jgi:hypothetical protein
MWLDSMLPSLVDPPQAAYTKEAREDRDLIRRRHGAGRHEDERQLHRCFRRALL